MGKVSKKLLEVINIAQKMNESDFFAFKNILKGVLSKDDELILEEKYAERNFIMRPTIVVKPKKSSIWKIYDQELEKINKVINNDVLIQKLEGLKILFYGQTGTGKTSLVNEIVSMNKNVCFEKLTLESILSSKLGQTQLNLISLSTNLKLKYRNKKVILFIDELDSIVSNRKNDNDVREHDRIVASFIKFLDEFDDHFIILAATNMISSIDVAVQRRFNIQIEGKLFSALSFAKLYNHENPGNELSIRLMNSTLILNDELIFSLADLEAFVRDVVIESEVHNAVDVFSIFWSKFKKALKLKEDGEISGRTKERLKL